MQHRHLNGDTLSLAAIDDIIERGQRADWARLGRAAIEDPEVLERIERVCLARRANAEAEDASPPQSFTAWECFLARARTQTKAMSPR